MQFLAEMIFEVVILFLLTLPGGFVLWLREGRPGSYMTFCDQNKWRSIAASLGIWAIFVLTILIVRDL